MTASPHGTETTVRPVPVREVETRLAPRYHVILWDSPDHSYEYVIEMLRHLLAMNGAEAYEVACTVDTAGTAICGTFPLEVAELRRDQIHAFGSDPRIARCTGSMQATIEHAP